MHFHLVTIFPNILDSYMSESILKRAQEKKIIKIKTHDIRWQAKDKHKSVDDKPYGGGSGMVMVVEPIYKTLKKIRRKKKSKIVLLSPKGKQFNQGTAKKYSKLDQLILVSGRYEGVDERVGEFVDEEISAGPYILSGGELPAMMVIEATVRFIPGVLGNQESLEQETFNYIVDKKDTLSHTKQYPQYTRPKVFKCKIKNKTKELKVPQVLLSGNHKKIEQWRKNN